MENAGTSQSERIDEERFCLSCGYNLRTLHWSGKCPECGRDVLDSMGRNLFAADLDWLRCVRRGMILLLFHMVAAVGAALAHSGLSSMLLYVLIPAGPKTGLLVDLARRGPFATAAALLPLLLYGAGAWLFTRTGVFEPIASSQTNTGMRWTSMVWTGLVGLCVLGSYFPTNTGSAMPPLIVGAMIAEVLLIILSYARLANLAEMARASRLAKGTRWMIVAHLLVMMLVMTCFLVDRRIAAVILGLLVLAGLILWVIYFHLLSKAIRRR